MTLLTTDRKLAELAVELCRQRTWQPTEVRWVEDGWYVRNGYCDLSGEEIRRVQAAERR